MNDINNQSPHIPVMRDEVLANIAPKDNEVYVDATFGAGGYSRALLEEANCNVYAFDRDPNAIARAREWVDQYKGRLILIEAPFARMEEMLANHNVEKVDGIVFDLGVSSMQLDEAERGFSFRHDGPLSMRMDGAKPDIADIIHQAEVEDLKMIFRVYGEEKRALNLAKAIVKARQEAPIETTLALSNIIEANSPNRYAGKNRKSIHPATRVFQALRIFINDELGQLAKALIAAENLLVEGGRLVAVTFHSLEARIVKRFFADRSGIAHSSSRHQPMMDMPEPSFRLPFRSQLTPTDEEQETNPRARSAALRAGIRTQNASRGDDIGFAGLPKINFSKSLTLLEIS